MQITDIEGNKIEVTDLKRAIMMAKRFMQYRHQDAKYIVLNNRLFNYWNDLHEKLLQLQSKLKTGNHGKSNS